MRKLVLAMAVTVCALSLAAVASAAAPVKTTTADSGSFDAPAGTICDFNYHQSFSEVVTQTIFSDGRVHTHFDISVVHTNVDTGYTLTERDHYDFLDITGVKYRNVGLAWHLRDPSGKLVVVRAGTV
jgi:opacity protein-like surface antigen